jgi:4-hydroxybenzoate polyprenyltransferase
VRGSGLVRSCHPVPSTTVTVGAVLLAVAAHNRAATCVLLAAAVLTGQLSIGWSNDRIDVRRDRRVEHPGKPLAYGAVSIRAADAAIAVSVVATCVFSVLLGWRAGGLHLLAVAAAWLYNAGVKRTVLSWLPYAFAFAALPAVATLALPDHPAPYGWILVVGALLGAAVNFTNAVPALAEDPHSDMHALPDRIGGHASLLVAALLTLISGLLITWSPPKAPTALSWAGLAVTVLLLVVGVPLLWSRTHTRQTFYGLLVVAPIQFFVLVITAAPLH